jgi:hypothetical protein
VSYSNEGYTVQRAERGFLVSDTIRNRTALVEEIELERFPWWRRARAPTPEQHALYAYLCGLLERNEYTCEGALAADWRRILGE